MSENVKKKTKAKVPSVKVENNSDLPDEAATEIAKQKRPKYPRPNRSENYKVHTAPGEMSGIISNALALRRMGKIDARDPEAVRQRVDDYLEYCIEHDMRPTVESMALAFSVDRTTLWRWKEGIIKEIPDSCVQEIRRAYNLMNEIMTQTLVDGKINPISAFFLLKNNHGYKDQTEIVVSPTNPYSSESSDTVRSKYLEGIPTEIEGSGTVE